MQTVQWNTNSIHHQNEVQLFEDSLLQKTTLPLLYNDNQQITLTISQIKSKIKRQMYLIINPHTNNQQPIPTPLQTTTTTTITITTLENETSKGLCTILSSPI
jgi:hypothetical protein